jgi:hypothetical protein
VSGRCRKAAVTKIAAAGLAVAALAVATLVGIDALGAASAPLSQAARFAAVVLTLAPVSFAMGWLFPSGLERLEELGGETGLALAVNGVASVVAAPLAVLFSSGLGFVVLLVGAAVCYVAAGAVARILGRGPQSTTTRRP